MIVESPFAIGSGVIIGHEDGKTIVLTSRDIVDGVSDPSQVTVTTNDGKIPAINITFASNGLNLAFVYIDALFGSVAISNAAVLGEDILSVAFDSASAGVVTGFSNATTSNNYPYQIINTNTDPSSGAGVFSDNSGNLIGIVTSDGSDLVVIDIGALSGTNSTNSTNPGGIVSCDPTDPECMACLQGQQNFILINDTVYCCGPGDYIFEDGIWSCR